MWWPVVYTEAESHAVAYCQAQALQNSRGWVPWDSLQLECVTPPIHFLRLDYHVSTRSDCLCQNGQRPFNPGLGNLRLLLRFVTRKFRYPIKDIRIQT